jgi:hypothetical protein
LYFYQKVGDPLLFGNGNLYMYARNDPVGYIDPFGLFSLKCIRVLGGIHLPDRIRAEIGETFKPAMAYPEIDIPMYKLLTGISSEHFLPNINYIEQNTISLLETNQKFIESYMVGLNHEFARELLWREYPTDQRGSYFRQFWDVSSYLNKDKLDPKMLREKLRDIPPLDKWSKRSDLGDHGVGLKSLSGYGGVTFGNGLTDK